MKKILLLQIDGKMPNLALMRIASHHCMMGDDIELRHAPTTRSVEPKFWDAHDTVYASLIFERSASVARRLLETRPDAIIGGTGWNRIKTLEQEGIVTKNADYSLYPNYQHSIGFTQRGCRLKCSFCVVPEKEGHAKAEGSIWSIWRGEPWPRNVLLLDNDFFGVPEWRQRIQEIKDGNFKVSFNQGINVRMIGQEEAEALASVRYFDDDFKKPCLYTAWDNCKDEDRLFRGLSFLKSAGIKPDSIMVYILIGYDHQNKMTMPYLVDSDFHRHQKLREFGCRPYPMPFVKNDELRGFQRWIIGAYDKRIPWARWRQANYRPERCMMYD